MYWILLLALFFVLGTHANNSRVNPENEISCIILEKFTKGNCHLEVIQFLEEERVIMQFKMSREMSTEVFKVHMALNRYKRYYLKLSSIVNMGWDSGSHVRVSGDYGNVLHDVFLKSIPSITVPIASAYSITMNSSCLYSAAFVNSNWKEYDFDDKNWSLVVTGQNNSYFAYTSYYRFKFTKSVYSIAYEARFLYKYGLVVYINGNEVYRDNMPSGIVSYDTFAIQEYESYVWRGIVRPIPGFDDNIVAVEMHSIRKDILFSIGAFNMWLMEYPASYNDDATCFYINEFSSISSTEGDASLLYDNNPESHYSSDVLQGNQATILFTHSILAYEVNGIAFLSIPSQTSYPKHYVLTTFWNDTIHLVADVQSNKPTNRKRVDKFPFNAVASRSFSFHVLQTWNSKLVISEMRLLVCKEPISLSTLQLNLVNWEGYTYTDVLRIYPIYRGYSSCTVHPSLPSGLSLDSTLCVVSGTLLSEVDQTYTMTALSPYNVSASFYIKAITCNKAILKVTRHYGKHPEREEYIIRNSEGVILYKEIPNTRQIMDGERIDLSCEPSGVFTIETNDDSHKQWEEQSYIDVNLVDMNESLTIELVKIRFDSIIYQSNTVEFFTDLLISFADIWSYWRDTVPAYWYSTNFDDSAWPKAKKDDYLSSTNHIQLYRHRFTVIDMNSIGDLELHMRYKNGCAVYINGEEVYRNHIHDGIPISIDTYAYDYYSLIIYRVIALSMRYAKLHPGLNANVIAIANIGAYDATTESYFDAAVRFKGRSKSSILKDFDISSTTITGDLSSLLNESSDILFVCEGCGGSSITLQLKEDRREIVTHIGILASELNHSEEPDALLLEAKNKNDDNWNVLYNSSMKWWDYKRDKLLPVYSSESYNTFRFKLQKEGTWSLLSLNLYYQYVPYASLQTLAYPFIRSLRILYLQLCPINQYYSYFKALSLIPMSLLLDPSTGCLYGPVGVSFPMLSVNVQSKSIVNVAINASIAINPAICRVYPVIFLLLASPKVPSNCIIRVYMDSISKESEIHVKNGLNYDSLDSLSVCNDEHIFYYVYYSGNGKGWGEDGGYTEEYMVQGIILDTGVVGVGDRTVIIDDSPVSATVSATYGTFLFRSENTLWKVLMSSSVVPTGWLDLSYDDTNWHTLRDNEISTNRQTVYFRYAITAPSALIYTLHLSVRYTGGFVAYLNHSAIARFNLPAEYDHDTISIIQTEQAYHSQFSVLYDIYKSTSAKSIIGFEFHAYTRIAGVYTPLVVIDGLYGVNTDCLLLNSATSSGLFELVHEDPLPYVNERDRNDASNHTGIYIDCYKSIDMEAYTYCEANITEPFVITISYMNLAGIAFNALVIMNYPSFYVKSISIYGRWTTPGELASENDWNLIATRSQFLLIGNTRNFFSIPAGMLRFNDIRLVIYPNRSNSIQDIVHINDIDPVYHHYDGLRCEGDADYPSVFSPSASPSACDKYYEGYKYKLCVDGVFGRESSELCRMRKPFNLTYSSSTYYFNKHNRVYVPAPVVENIVEFFNCSNLPSSLHMHQDGSIDGIANVAGVFPILVFVGNEGGETSTEITLVIEPVYCQATKECNINETESVCIYPCRTLFIRYNEVFVCTNGKNSIGEWKRSGMLCVSSLTALIAIAMVTILIVWADKQIAHFYLRRKTLKKSKDLYDKIFKNSRVTS